MREVLDKMNYDSNHLNAANFEKDSKKWQSEVKIPFAYDI